MIVFDDKVDPQTRRRNSAVRDIDAVESTINSGAHHPGAQSNACTTKVVKITLMEKATAVSMQILPAKAFHTHVVGTPVISSFKLSPGFGAASMTNECCVQMGLDHIKNKIPSAVLGSRPSRPRNGIIRTPKCRSKFPYTRILMHSEYCQSRDDAEPEPEKYSGMWIAQFAEVVAWLKRQDPSESLYPLGVTRQIVGVMPNGKQLTVAPKVSELPQYSDEGVVLQSPPENCTVLTWTLTNLHQETFLYEAQREALGRLIISRSDHTRVLLHQSNLYAFRSFAGLSLVEMEKYTPSETIVYGAVGSKQRLETVKWLHKRMNEKLSTTQLEFLRVFRGPLVQANCAAGAGKTQLIVALALQSLHSEADIGVYISQPNKSMVRETYHRLIEAHGDKFRIACMGVDQSGTTDMFN
jgi:hypothetical protein